MLVKNVSPIVISEQGSLTDALVQLTKSQKKVLICVDQLGKLTGVIADGDIRRALIEGKTVDSLISAAMTQDPVIVSEQVTEAEATRLLSQKIPVLPVVALDGSPSGYYSLSDSSAAINIKGKKVTILGMGYVGLTLGLVMADEGFSVTGVDNNFTLIEQLKNAEAPFYEIGLQGFLTAHGNKGLKFKENIDDAISDIYIITVGTPLLTDGSKKPNVNHVESAASAIASVLKTGDLVVLRSTLPVGCSRNSVIKILNEKAGLECGKDYFLAFVPERTAEGKALMELRQNPQIVGGFDRYSTELASRLFNEVTNAIIDVGSIEVAELCKLVDNSFRDHVFAFSNQLAELTEALNMDANKLIDAVNYGYKRNMIPKPSPGVGGPCLSKDPYILAGVMESVGIDSTLIKSTRHVNEVGPQRLARKLDELIIKAGKVKSKCKISIVGFGFKGEPETSDLRDSTSLWFINELEGFGKVCGYDPVVEATEIEALGIEPVDLKGAFEDTDAIVILNNHRSYQTWDLAHLTKEASSTLIFIDSWHIFDPAYLKRLGNLLVGGIGND